MHFMIAQDTASTSSSIIAYSDCASSRNCEPAWMRDHVSPVFCPERIGSRQYRVGLAW